MSLSRLWTPEVENDALKQLFVVEIHDTVAKIFLPRKGILSRRQTGRPTMRTSISCGSNCTLLVKPWFTV